MLLFALVHPVILMPYTTIPHAQDWQRYRKAAASSAQPSSLAVAPVPALP